MPDFAVQPVLFGVSFFSVFVFALGAGFLGAATVRALLEVTLGMGFPGCEETVTVVPVLWWIHCLPRPRRAEPLGATALERALKLPHRRSPRTLTAVVPVVALCVGVTFSLNYWGFPWSLPDLDSRVKEVVWTRVSVFTSDEGGTHWTAQPREELSQIRTEPAADLECCEYGRILKVVGEKLETLEGITPAELATLETAVLTSVPLERGEPGYRYARRLRGVALMGTDANSRPVAFASFISGEVSNDHHAMYDVLLELGVPATLLSSSRTYGDVAGIEGFTAGSVAFALTVFGFFLTATLLVVWSLLVASVRAIAERRRRPV